MIKNQLLLVSNKLLWKLCKKCSKSSWLQKANKRYLPLQTRAVEGHVSLHSVKGLGKVALSGVRCRSRRRRSEIPSLKSVLPAHVEDWLRGAVQGMLKHFWRPHKSLLNVFPLVRTPPGGGDYFFLLPTLKKMHGPLCEQPPPAFFLFFTVPPNDTRRLYVILLIIIGRIRGRSRQWVMKCGFHNHV